MNYYEELGVATSAQPKEIRSAYRKLAQVLHPDLQQDETLRLICARQLARLNQIEETLTNPRKRREYDALLRGEVPNPADAPPRIQRIRESLSALNMETWVWVTAAIVGSVLMLVLFRWNAAPSGETPYRPAGAPQDARTQVKGAPAAARTRASRHKPASPPRLSPAGPSDTAPLPPDASEPGPPAIAAPTPQAEPPQIAQPATTEPLAPTPARPVSTSSPPPRPEPSYFAGRWFFSHDVGRSDRALYPPEMIELAITGDNGVLRGSYRSRYRVPDRPISPDVSFQFEGPAANGQAVELAWTGPGGAQGRVRLTSITPVSMEVKWWATRLGTLGLASGTAVLVRGDER
jgi:hypothetical protein